MESYDLFCGNFIEAIRRNWMTTRHIFELRIDLQHWKLFNWKDQNLRDGDVYLDVVRCRKRPLIAQINV